jgi:hypothetical protein
VVIHPRVIHWRPHLPSIIIHDHEPTAAAGNNLRLAAIMKARHSTATLPPWLNSLRRLARAAGPGIITGAADDDPSGIVTYTIVGAQAQRGTEFRSQNVNLVHSVSVFHPCFIRGQMISHLGALASWWFNPCIRYWPGAGEAAWLFS